MDKLELLLGRAPIQFAIIALVAGCKAAAPPPELPEGAVVYVPEGMEDQPVEAVAVAFHGRGDRPDRFVGLYQSLEGPYRVVLLRAPHDFQKSGYTWFESSSKGDAKVFSDEVAAQAAAQVPVLDAVQAHFGVAADPVVTGFSQGGILSWTFAAEHADHISAALPVGGFLPEGLEASGQAVPVQAFHGELDQEIPVGRAKASEARLESMGTVKLHLYPQAGHSIPEPMRSEYIEALATALRDAK